MLCLLLFLIIIVVAFNIISGLTILVKNKTREIAILKSIGVLNKSIVKIFFFSWDNNRNFSNNIWSYLGNNFFNLCGKHKTNFATIFNISLFPEEIYFKHNAFRNKC